MDSLVERLRSGREPRELAEYADTLVEEIIARFQSEIIDGTLAAEQQQELLDVSVGYVFKHREFRELMLEAADRIDALEKALVEEREENLWNAYHSGGVRDGRWTHMFMSGGEWLARQCDFDPQLPGYDDAEIKAAIPIAARKALKGDA